MTATSAQTLRCENLNGRRIGRERERAARTRVKVTTREQRARAGDEISLGVSAENRKTNFPSQVREKGQLRFNRGKC